MSVQHGPKGIVVIFVLMLMGRISVPVPLVIPWETIREPAMMIMNVLQEMGAAATRAPIMLDLTHALVQVDIN